MKMIFKAVSFIGNCSTNFLIDDGPKKPIHELSETKIITAAASSYIIKDFDFSPVDEDKFKVFENSTATAHIFNH